MNDNQKDKEKTPSPVNQADDRGFAGSEPVSTTEENPSSALGGHTATRSGADPDGKEKE